MVNGGYFLWQRQGAISKTTTKGEETPLAMHIVEKSKKKNLGNAEPSIPSQPRGRNLVPGMGRFIGKGEVFLHSGRRGGVAGVGRREVKRYRAVNFDPRKEAPIVNNRLGKGG